MGMFTNPLRRSLARFPTIGSEVSGSVTEVKVAPVPEFDDSGRMIGPKFDLDGNPINQIDVAVRVEDGSEVVIHTGGDIFYAIQKALNKIKADDLHVGDTLTVTYIGDGEPPVEGFNAPKLYEATITKA